MAENTPKVETITIPINPDLSPEDRDALIRQLAPKDPLYGVVGNFADVQRGGAAVVTGSGSMSDGVQTPPGTTEQDLATSTAVSDAIDKANEQADKLAT